MSMTPIHRTNTHSAPPPVGEYTHLTVVAGGSDILVLAGQVGIDAKGNLPASLGEQLRNALANALTILESEGCSADNIIKVNLWFVDMIGREDFLEIWRDFHKGAPPSTTLAYVKALVQPQYKVEVEVWAARMARSGPR